MRIGKWQGECRIDLETPLTKGKPPHVEGKRQVWRDAKHEIHFYSLEPTAQYEEGGFEIEVILKEKPSSNKITFDIETKNLRFLYQPELTPEEIEQGLFRPENVVGSYAVYHTEPKGVYDNAEEAEKYKTGKAFHIYRPRIVDAAGKEIWGELHIDEKKGTLTVAIPHKFLDTAVYPVRHAAGLEFGYTSKGGTVGNIEDIIHGSVYNCPDNALGYYIYAYIFKGAGYEACARMALYKDSDKSFESGTTQSTWGTAEYDGWWNRPFTPTLPYKFAAGDYYLVVWMNDAYPGGASIANLWLDADAGVTKGNQTAAYGGCGVGSQNPWPDPYDPNLSTGKVSIYCLYVAATTVYNQKHFRFFNDDGTVLNDATAMAAEDTDISNVEKETNFRIRYSVANTGTWPGDIRRRLEWRVSGGSWATIDILTGAVRLSSSTKFADGDATTNRLTLTGTFMAGQGKESGSDATQISLTDAYCVEDEWCVAFNPEAAAGATYEFRVTRAGYALNTYTQTGKATVKAVVAGNIKVISGVAWGSVKKVSGVAEASIKKVSGVTAN